MTGQRAGLVIDPRLARVAIDFQPAKAQGGAGALALAARPAQHGANPRQQFACLERLRQIVVGAQLQADDAVGLIAARGQHHHRQVRAAAYLPAHVEAIAVRQHEVENHQVCVVRAQPCQAVGGGFGVRDIESGVGRIVDHHTGQAGVVFDHQQGLMHQGRFPPATGRPSASRCQGTARAHQDLAKRKCSSDFIAG